MLGCLISLTGCSSTCSFMCMLCHAIGLALALTTYTNFAACRIKQVSPRDWKVSLTTRSLDLNNDRYWEERYCADPEFGGDECYHVRTMDEIRAEANAKRQQLQQRKDKNKEPFHRPIRHPNFKNISMMKAAEDLTRGEVGDVIVRPSHKSSDQICLTMKVTGP